MIARPLCAILVACSLTATTAFAIDVCNVSGLGSELSKFSMQKCDGSLSYREAIDCLNRKIDEAADQRERAERAIAQAECLCKALNEIVDGFGHYSRLRGSCSVEK